ncbi:O-methyltransferase [Candidatus Acetothermia bacterium]|nr:O-methyltransferase [Candidatus Acetothermia bacterium]
MDEITREHVEKYLHNLLLPRDALLTRLEAEAEQRNIPIVGPHAASFLALTARSIRARRILEIGTAIGYSTIWLARACGRGGRVITIEVNEETAEEARKNIADAKLSKQVTVIVGDGMEVIPTLTGRFDFVFNDADKHQYRDLVELILPKLKRGGIIATDNVLWAGRVASIENDPTTQAIRNFNEFLKDHPALETVTVPLRDGIALSRKR